MATRSIFISLIIAIPLFKLVNFTMKKFLALSLICVLALTVKAQQQIEPCGFDQLLKVQLKDPEYKKYVDKLDNQIYNLVQEAQKDPSLLKAGNILTIPIVFHVIHLGEAQDVGTNISDAQCESAVRGLNVFYRNNKKWGTSQTAVPFNPNTVDLEIEFCLAQRDPAGQPTNGITRVDGHKYTNYFDQGITSANETTIINDQGWDKNKYYNVFVVSEINDQGGNGSGNVGNANFPPSGSTPSATNDRTVVIWKSCGYCDIPGGDPCPFKNTSLVAPYDNGTMNHEIGHAFSLYHTFHDNGNADLANQGGGTGQPIASCNNANETDCNVGGDRCCDTQRHLGNLGTCPTGKTNECINAPYDVYTANNCMNYTNCQPLLFTANQRDRCKAAFASNTVRINLTNSDGCNPVFAYDIGLKSITEPSGYYCTTSVGGKVLVKNFGGNTITSFSVDVQVDGVSASTYTWTGSLASNTETTITIPAVTATNGTHTYKVVVIANSINGSQADGQSSNNTVSTSFQIINNGSVVTVAGSNFDTGDKVVIKNASSGAVVKTVTMSAAGTSYSENVCLPQGCYTFEVTDADFQPTNLSPPGTVPDFTVKDDHGYTIAKGITVKTATSGAEVGRPKTETTSNKCLPYNPGYLDADFIADKFTVVQGTSVQFTDLTVLAPNGPTPPAPGASSWAWDFGDGGTDNVKNPIHQFNTPGVYTVKLTADNGIAPDTETKIHYIRVIPTQTGCDKFDNLIAPEAGVYQTTVNGAPGYFPGPNTTNPISYAEKFFAPTSSNLKSVDIYTAIVNSTNPNARLKVTIYGNAGGLPGSAIGVVNVPYSNLTVGNYTTGITFPTPVSVTDIFFVGVEVSNAAAGDTVVLAAANYRGANDYSNTAYVLYGGNWKPVNTAITGASATSLAIRANLSALPIAKFDSNVIQICNGKSITYDASLSTNANSYEWTFEAGSPPTSTAVKPAPVYNLEGVKKVTLVVKGGCAETDTLVKTITVAPPPTVTVEVVDEVCSKSNGSAKAIPAGGSGDFTFTWNTTPVQTSVIATGLKAGAYKVTMKDNQCGTVSGTGTISDLPKLPDFDVEVGNTTCGQNNGYAKANPVGGSGTYTYTWTKTGDASFTQTGRTLSSVGPGTYTVEVQDGSCNPNQKTITISASAGVSGGVTSSSTAICEGEQVTLTANGGSSYLWNDGYTNFAYQATVDVSPSSSKTYTVRITDTAGCFIDVSKTVVVTQSPRAYAVSSNNNINYDETTTVDIAKNEYAFFSSSGSLGNTFKWMFGDGDSTNVKNPYHKYTTPGIYKVYLFVNIDGCVTMDSCSVTVINSGSVGIAGNNKFNIGLYPNPATDMVVINNPDQISITAIQVFDVVGKQVISLNANDQLETINLSALSTGSYTFKIHTSSGTMIQKLEIIK